MASLKSWIKAARLRTLPLAVSGILMGAALAGLDEGFNLKVTILLWLLLYLSRYSRILPMITAISRKEPTTINVLARGALFRVGKLLHRK